jgi:hypothetical protein
LEISESRSDYLEESTSHSREKILRDFGELDIRIDVDIILLELSFFENELAHKLTEEFAHIIEASLAELHAISFVTHSEEHRFDAASVR